MAHCLLSAPQPQQHLWPSQKCCTARQTTAALPAAVCWLAATPALLVLLAPLLSAAALGAAPSQCHPHWCCREKGQACSRMVCKVRLHLAAATKGLQVSIISTQRRTVTINATQQKLTAQDALVTLWPRGQILAAQQLRDCAAHQLHFLALCCRGGAAAAAVLAQCWQR